MLSASTFPPYYDVPIILPPVCGGIAPLHTKSATELQDNTLTSPVYQPYI
jgi:hypothetical protein